MEVDALDKLKEFTRGFDTGGDAASALAVSKQYLHQMLTEERPISPRVLAKLGLKRAVVQK